MIPKLGFFPIHGNNETEFAAALALLPADFHRAMRDRIRRSIVDPTNCGVVILEQCGDVIRVFNLPREMQRFLFLLFVRLFFDEIYLNVFAIGKIVDAEFDFQSRVFALRKLSPVAFGCTEPHIPGHCVWMRLCEFPPDHPYKQAVESFGVLSFTLSPVDFCMAAKVGLEIAQQVASQLAFDSHTKKTGQVLARTDHLLSLDELFDVSFIVFLLSDPIDVLSVIGRFDPFIEGLQLPSALQFAFSHMKALCEHIAHMDIQRFVRDARLREQASGDLDPLNIMAAPAP